jgi:hypothetical protein
VNERGWIKLWRQLAEHELWLRERFTRGQAWCDLLMSANHTEHQLVRGGRPITVRRGQVYGSQVALARRWRWTRETVGLFLKDLNKAGMISDIIAVRGADIGYTLLTISNYERYQGVPAEVSDISSDIPKNGSKRSKEGSPPLFRILGGTAVDLRAPRLTRPGVARDPSRTGRAPARTPSRPA